MTARPPPAGGVGARARSVFGNAVRGSCRERGCSLGLEGLSDYAVLKGEDAVGGGGKACDCVVVHGPPPRISLVELKSGNVKHSQVVEKFSVTAGIVPLVEREVFGGAKCRLALLLLTKRRQRKSFYRVWRAEKFRIAGKRHSVQVLPCGIRLVDAYRTQ